MPFKFNPITGQLDLVNSNPSTDLQNAYDNGDGVVDIENNKPVTIQAAPTQTDNLFEINSNGGSGGDLFELTSTGALNVSRGTSSTNFFVGEGGNTTTTGDYNIGVANNSLASLTSGDRNIAIGRAAGSAITNGTRNFLLGYLAGQFGNGNNTVAIGDSACRYAVAGSFNIAIGTFALGGESSGVVTGASGNVAIGERSMASIGTNSDYNVSIGSQSLVNVSGGNENIIIGHDSGDTIQNGSNNILIGSELDVATASTSNTLNIGNLIFGTGLTTGSTVSTGNVGIGTASTAAKLTVDGGITIARNSVIKAASDSVASFSFANENGESIVDIDGSNGVLAFSGAGSPSDLVVSSRPLIYNLGSSLVLSARTNTGAASIRFITHDGSGGAVEKMRLWQTGELVLGDTSVIPDAKLHILGNSNQVQLAVEANATQTANLFEINSNGGSGGDLFVVDDAENVGIGTTSPSAKLDVNSDILRLRNAKTPASSGATGNQGDFAWDSNYLYICVASNTWRRVAHATW